MSGTTPNLPGQDGQQNDPTGVPVPPPVNMPPLPPLPWEQQNAAPAPAPQDPAAAPGAQPTPYGAGAAQPPQDPYAAQHAQDPYAAAYGRDLYATPAPQGTGAYAAGPGGYAAAPQQTAPQQTAPYATTQPYATTTQAYGTQPYGAAPYGAQPPKKKGMPTWAWWAIGVGAVVVVGAVIAVTAVINLILPYTETAGTGTDTGTSDTDTGGSDTGSTDGGDTGTDTGTDSGSTDGGDAGGSAGAAADYPLRAVVPVLDFAFEVPALEGWSISDQDEYYTFAENGTNPCVFEAQTMDLYGADAAAADDTAATAADFPAYFEEIGVGTEIVSQEFEEVASVAIDSPAGTIEFATYDSIVTWSDGSEYLERWYFRSFVDTETTMYAYLSCPAADFTEAELDATIDALSIR